jgi:tRNA-binding protein
MPTIAFEDFQAIDLAVGTIVSAELNTRARVPAYVLRIDFGPEHGERTSSAQLTARYVAEELIGKQVVAVMNFAPKRVAGVRSEVLVLGAVSAERDVVLLEPGAAVANGARVA